MRRRDIVAGVGSLGLLAGAGALLRNGTSSSGNEGPDASSAAEDEDGESDGPLEVETIDAPGSDAGTVAVPDDRVTVITFFVTGCGQCQAQVPEIAAAREDLVDGHGNDVRFLWTTYQSFDRMPADDLRDWWATQGGEWAVGYDQNSALSAAYGVVGYPVTVVIDRDGENRWQENGVVRSRGIVEAVEPVLEDG